MANFLNIDGTQEDAFKIDGPAGPQIKNDAGAFKLRNSGDSADAAVSASTATLSTAIIFDETNDLTVNAPSQTGAPRTASFPALAGDDEITCNAATQTLAAKTLTTPTIVNNGAIIDENANEQVAFITTGSAVNYSAFKNNTTGNPPQILAEGSDTNVTLALLSKGTGSVFIGSASNTDTGKIEIADNDNSANVALTVPATVTGSYTLEFPNQIGTANQVLEISSIAGSTASLAFVNQGSVGGSQQCLRLTRNGASGAGSQNSTTTLPANTIVQQVIVNVTGALNNTPTLTVGLQGGAADLFMGTTDSDLSITGVYSKFIDESIGGSADEISITVGGTPNTGAFAVTIVYCEAPLN